MHAQYKWVEALERRTFLAATLFQDLGPGPYHGTPRELTTFDEELYFIVSYRNVNGNSGVFGYLWRTDGTQAGTEQVAPAPSPTLVPGGISDLVNWSQALQFYYGTWGVNVASDRLWFYNIDHDGSANMLLVTLNSIDADGNARTYDLGRVNLSAQQNVNDIQNFNGRMYFYRDGDRSSPDPAVRAGYWWTVNDAGEIFSTGVTDRNAFNGDGPDRATSAAFDGRRFFAHEAPIRAAVGREMYTEPLAWRTGAGAAGTAFRTRAGSANLFSALPAIRRDPGLDELLR